MADDNATKAAKVRHARRETVLRAAEEQRLLGPQDKAITGRVGPHE